MGQLLNTDSGGQSEVIETLHFQGAITNGIQLFRIGDLVSKRWGGDENREASDPTFQADTLTVLQQLQGLGYVQAFDAVTGAALDLNTANLPGATRVALTAVGRTYARHPRPRPRYMGKSVN